MNEYDVVVIGGGTAGSNAARAAQKAGAQKVLLIHLPKFLNTCVEEGCMPSKSIIHSSEERIPFEEATRRMDTHIDRLLGSLQSSLTEEFEFLVGEASFLPQDKGLKVVQDDKEKIIHSKRYVIATGSTPFIPPVPGLETLQEGAVLTSHDIVSHDHIHTLPKSIFILGGGPIGLEMMTVFAGFGARVFVAERGDILSRMDPEFGDAMRRAIEHMDTVTLLSPASLTSVKEEGNELVFSVEMDNKDNEYRADKLLVATGRRPVLDSLLLENVGILDEKGRLLFNESTLQSQNPNIYIAGDVTGKYQILHYASSMGRVAGHNAAVGKAEQTLDYEKLNMGIIFSEPQVGQIGLTEQEAEERGIETISTTLDLPNIGRGLLENVEVGLWKLTAQKTDGKIIGAQALSPSPHSEWFIDTVGWLMYFGATVDDLEKKTPYYHPTYPELFQSMGRKLCHEFKHREDDTISPGQ